MTPIRAPLRSTFTPLRRWAPMALTVLLACKSKEPAPVKHEPVAAAPAQGDLHPNVPIRGVPRAAAGEPTAADGAATGETGATAAADEVVDTATPAEPAKPADPTKAEPTAEKPTAEKPAAEKPAAEKPAAEKPTTPVSEIATAAAKGKEIYENKCQTCHGADGAADTKMGKKHEIDSWKEPGWKSKWSLAKVKQIVTEGKPDTKMKAFKDKLSPEEIDAVSLYARSLGK